jgi:hypothetical protein
LVEDIFNYQLNFRDSPPTERTGLFEGDLRCLSRLGCLTSVLMMPFLTNMGFFKPQNLIKIMAGADVRHL